MSLKEFDPSQNYLLSISDIEGYETQFIEFEIQDEKDGPIPGIKLFKDLNIYPVSYTHLDVYKRQLLNIDIMKKNLENTIATLVANQLNEVKEQVSKS